jgi:hypothetical protein
MWFSAKPNQRPETGDWQTDDVRRQAIDAMSTFERLEVYHVALTCTEMVYSLAETLLGLRSAI